MSLIAANIFDPFRIHNHRPRMAPLVAIAFGVTSLAACAWFPPSRAAPPRRPPPVRVPSEPLDVSTIGFPPDVDSLATALLRAADTTPPADLPVVEDRIHDWLSRFQFEDPRLIPIDRAVDPKRFHRSIRARLLDALGVAAFRRGEHRRAEAALVSAVAELNSRGTTSGFALHYHHLGDVLKARGRWDEAIEAYLDAEARGMGRAATPELEAAWRRRHGSLRGLDAKRAERAARIEDERRQILVAGAGDAPLPRFRWPRRTGPPLASSEVVGRPLVVAAWDEEHPAWPASLEDLARALRRRGGTLLGVYLGVDPGAVDAGRTFPVVLPPEPEAARLRLGIEASPALLVVDEAGRIRYRHARPASEPVPVDDIVIQIDHLRGVRTR